MEKVVSASRENIKKAAEVLAEGGLVVAPTNSVYGLFCDATNEKAVARLSEIKERDPSKPLQVAVLKKDAGLYGTISKRAQAVIDAFWPGDVNIVVEKTAAIPDFISKKTVCLTCHANKVAFALVKLSGKPLVSTSANLEGAKPPSWVGEVSDVLKSEVDLVLDGGAARHGRPNTIVDLTVNPARILREGSVSREELLEIIGVE
ncbi:MAG: L-threonylcarbamoyladenylate synthase [Methanobacteriota archaeon]